MLWSPFSVLGLDLLSPRKAGVQEQTFHLSRSLLCWKQAIAMSTSSGSREGPAGLWQERSWPVAWEMMGYLIRSHLQLFITLTNYLITWSEFFLS